MRVISSSTKYRRVECPYCKAELEYEASDINSMVDVHKDVLYFIECPVCKTKITLSRWNKEE